MINKLLSVKKLLSGNLFSRFPSNSEAFASELLGNLEEILQEDRCI